jgi:arylsulfatase A-like enzyme
VRIPLIVRWPTGLQSGVASQQVAALVDLAPTLLDLVGVETPSHMRGRSLASILSGEQPSRPDDYAIIETGRGIGIRTPTHLYGLPFVDGTHQLANTPDMFFDLGADPYQMRNLAGTGEQVDAARELDRQLRAWDARTPWLR